MPRQSDLRYTFEPSDSPAAFDVIEFKLEEGLSRPFLLTLELSSRDPNVDFTGLLDNPALFTIWRAEQPVRYVHGLISAFSQGDTGFRRTRYHAVVEPRLARAGLRSNWRIFQQKSVPQILDSVLKAQRLTDCKQVISASHEVREYCVQAGETDLDFLARLAAEEGLLYTFEHSAKGHRLIYTDRVQCLGEIGPDEARSVIYQSNRGVDQAQPTVQRFRYTEQVRSASQVQRDYTFKNPRYNQQHSATARDLQRQSDEYERYDFPGGYKRDAAGKPFTQTRLAALRRDARIALVEGDDARLQPGKGFALIEHPREDINAHWRVVSIEHHGTQYTSQEEDAADSQQGTNYLQKASLIPGSIDWKAEVWSRPRIDGPQMATVVGPPNEQIFCDEWGRVKISFPWDRDSPNNEHSSCWVRVAQGWAGTMWGAVAIPRIGQEVIVSYVDGDPDQPIITGRTFCATNVPPYELPRHKTLATLKSAEHKGKRANELRFDDTSDQVSAALMSGHADTAVHLGYLTHPRTHGGAPRGQGFELRTDAAGAMRAAQGLLISTEAQIKAGGGQLERQQIIAVLESALELARSLGNQAGEHQGIVADSQPQQLLSKAVVELGADNDSRNRPGVIAVSAPGGLASATPASVICAAGENIDAVAGKNQQLSAGQRLVLNAGGELGLHAQAGDLRQIAHRGELRLQAQHNDIKLEADQSVEVTAAREHVLIAADKHVTLMCGGAYLKLENGNVELGMPGTFTIKAEKIDVVGPAHASMAFNSWPSTRFNEHFEAVLPDGSPASNRRYEFIRSDGARIPGVTDSNGKLALQQGLSPENIAINWLDPVPASEGRKGEAGKVPATRRHYACRLEAADYSIRQLAYLPVEGVGVNGIFFIKGDLKLDGQQLFVSALGFTTALMQGNVEFHATAEIQVNGKRSSFASLQRREQEMWPAGDYVPIGSATLTLPAVQPLDEVLLLVRGGYIYSAPEGRAVPMPSAGAASIALAVVELLPT